jgi:hypothetical protein
VDLAGAGDEVVRRRVPARRILYSVVLCSALIIVWGLYGEPYYI